MPFHVGGMGEMWNRGRWVVALGTLLSVFVATPATASGWLRDVDHALGVARKVQRPMVLFVSMDGCTHCHRMIETTFRDTGVRRTLGTSFVATAIKGSERPDLMEQLKIRSFPTTLLVSSEGQVLDQMVGYVSAEKFQRHLQVVLRRRQDLISADRRTALNSSSYAAKATAAK